MAAVELLPVASTAATSGDFSNAAGATTTVALKSADGTLGIGCNATIQFKASNNQYVGLGAVTQNEPVRVLTATGTFRVVKDAVTSGFAYGVDTQVA